MRARAAAVLLRWFGRFGLFLSVVVFVGLSLVTSINFKVMPSFGSTDTPETRASQTIMDKATASAAGQQLKTQGYTAKEVLSDSGVTDWLVDQEKNQSVANPGPFVRFATGDTQAAKPGSDVPPDILVDATNGVMVALSQSYSDNRGAACYNASDIRIFSSQWVAINVYLWSKTLDASYVVKKDDVPQLPSSLGDVSCYTFVS